MEEKQKQTDAGATGIFAFRLPRDLKDRLAERAKSERRSISNLLVCIIARFLKLEEPPINTFAIRGEGETFQEAIKDSKASAEKIEVEIEETPPPSEASKIKMAWVAEMPKICLSCGKGSLINNQIPQTWACNDCFASGAYGEKNRPKEK